MTELEHALTKVQQELIEAAHAISKALEFGLEDTYPERGCTNRELINKELNDFYGARTHLNVLGLQVDPNWKIIGNEDDGQIHAKIVKIEKWKVYSTEKGIITA